MGNRIIIDLHETDTQSFKDINLIQIDGKKKFTDLIDIFLGKNKSKQSATQKKTSTSFPRVHNTILIDGRRGMGKTSFMLSVLDDENLKKNICSLGIIDPTLIETSEHVFLNIITQIKCRIDEAARCRECEYTSKSEYKSWKESLRKLAGGLSMLDGVGGNHLEDNSLWDSPELILERGLSNAKHGYALEEDFHTFIDESLKVLNRDVFLLVLDDVDTSLDKGKEILEVLRKYLTSPKLIIVLLGDIDLYSTLVRQLQWEKLDPKKILKDYEGKDKYLDQIEHLEEQYLVKVLKPENRINLKNLYDLKKELIIKSQKESLESKESQLCDFMSRMLENVYLTTNSRYANCYERTLLTQSTRSIIQVLQSWSKREENTEYFLTTVKHTFYTTLKKKLEPYGLLEIPQQEQFLNLLSMYILKEGIGRDSHLKLTPEFSKNEDNIAIFYLNAMANFLLKPSDYPSYFIIIGYALERYQDLHAGNHDNFERFVDHVGMDSNDSISKISKKLLSTLPIASNRNKGNSIFFGNLFISNENMEKLDNKENLALLLSRVHNPKGGSYNFLSIFNLFGFVADIAKSDQVENILKEINLVKTFYVYDNSSESIKETGETNDDDSFDVSDQLKKELEEWHGSIRKVKQKLSLADLASIWIRFVYSINDIENRSENKKKNYCELFELYIAAFLNACYVICEQKKGKNVNIKNPSTSKEFFKNKLNEYTADNNILTLFDYYNTCPLLSAFRKYFDKLNNLKIYSDNSSSIVSDFSSLKPEEQNRILKSIYEKVINSGDNEKLKEDLLKYKEKTESDKNSIAGEIRKLLAEKGYKKGFNKYMLNSIIQNKQ
ncbi:MAG: hypothetical protein IBX45_08705 [Campylobacterales bacterium]|nr:hypothetical protein [Campylobacterales bacterium]